MLQHRLRNRILRHGCCTAAWRHILDLCRRAISGFLFKWLHLAVQLLLLMDSSRAHSRCADEAECVNGRRTSKSLLKCTKNRKHQSEAAIANVIFNAICEKMSVIVLPCKLICSLHLIRCACICAPAHRSVQFKCPE